MGRIDLRSQSLDLLRFPLAVVVLTIHIFSTEGITFQGTTSNFEDYPFFMEVNRFIDGFFRGQSVPIYCFISGFVFFLGVEMTRETYIRKFKNRVKTLLVPYLIWNFFAILLLIVTIYSPFNQYKAHPAEFTPSLQGFLSAFWVYHGQLEGTIIEDSFPLNKPLWFVRNLILVVLCTPFIHYLLKRTRYYLVVLLGGIWFFSPLFHIKTYLLDVTFFFFVWGAYMSINKKDMLVVFGRFFKVSVILYIALGVVHVFAARYYPDLTGIIKRINILVGLLFAYNLSAWLLKNGICKVNAFLASASFFIYVSHGLISCKILKLAYVAIRPASSISLLAVYISVIIITVGLLLLTFYLLRRYAPETLKVIAGRK